MIGSIVRCSRKGCEVEFAKATHNMKYCSPECCRLATNANIMVKYHERAAIRRGKTRVCKVCNVTKLSRYNESSVCGACESKNRDEVNITIDSIIDSVSWL